MAFFGSSKDDEDESLNDARVRRYREDTPLFPVEDLTKIKRVVEFYVRAGEWKTY